MRPTSIVAIYVLFWAFSFFLVLPFRLRRAGASDRAVPGEMQGSQGGFSFARTSAWTTIVSLLLFGLFYANYVEGWLPLASFDWVPRGLLDR